MSHSLLALFFLENSSFFLKSALMKPLSTCAQRWWIVVLQKPQLLAEPIKSMCSCKSAGAFPGGSARVWDVTPHSLAPGLLQNVLVLVDLNLTCFQFTALE